MITKKYIRLFEKYSNTIDYKTFAINLYNNIKIERYSDLQLTAIKNIINNSLTEDDWNILSKKYKLTRDFIREFQDQVYWYFISKYQTLTEDFIKEFQDKVVYWYDIFKYQELSEEFKKEVKHKPYG